MNRDRCLHGVDRADAPCPQCDRDLPRRLDSWHRLAPGVYDDNRGGLHLLLPEFLAANGYADTPENRQTLIEAARDAFGAITVEE
jgi:hypothetical protein